MRGIKIFCAAFLLFFTVTFTMGQGGMWLPQLVEQLNETEMQDLGMKMSAKDIWDVNNGSLKDAIVHFNGGCTAEIISKKGLILTNHHCGYSVIQAHSSLENNYIDDGFWAASKKEELANPNLTVTFIDRIEDVTQSVLKGVSNELGVKERQALIDKNLKSIKDDYKIEAWQETKIKPFFNANQYFLFVTTKYKDIRLVGAPPSSIGKFGADTDNWVWPRHNADFSLFRIYADKNNRPAEYSEDNVPYKPKHFLPISIDGVEEGDFTMVFGFPGRTNEYLPAVAVDQIMNDLDPPRIAIREKSLAIVDKAMRNDPQVKIQYASKFARIANYWKKWIGEVQGLTKSKAIDKKKQFEAEFTKRVKASPKASAMYGNILNDFQVAYRGIKNHAVAREYYHEIIWRNTELLGLMSSVSRYVRTYEKNGSAAFEEKLPKFKKGLDGFFKNYQSSIDQEVFEVLIEKMLNDLDATYIPDYLNQLVSDSGNDYKKLANYVYSNSIFTSQEKTNNLFNENIEDMVKLIQEDPAFTLFSSFVDVYRSTIAANYENLKSEIDELQRKYMQAQMDLFPEKAFYPDANSTLRITYGNVQGYAPRDAVYYKPVTYLDGVIEKYVPGDYEFDLPEKLIELHRKKDFGRYADKNGLPVCFIGTNHTTGGNSGSPALDAHGNLIGLNFDRVWEGTMSDINYDPEICRNIMVDVRYILFIIDKYAEADHLIKEMKLVHPKRMR